MVGTGSPVSFRRRPPLASRGGPDCQSSATVNPRVGTRVRRGPVRHDNHAGQRMTPGAPTDGARSRLPGHRGSTEAGTTLKDSGEPRRASKGVPCVSPLIDEAGAGFLGSSPMRSAEASCYPQRSLWCRDFTSALLTFPSRQCFRALVVITCRQPQETTSTSLHTTRDLSTTRQPLPCRAPAAVPTHRTPASSRVYGRGRGPKRSRNRITRGSSCRSRWHPARRGSPRTRSRRRSRPRCSSSSPWPQPSARR